MSGLKSGFYWLLVALAGCMGTASYEKKLDAWMGQSIDYLVNSWGYYNNSFEAPNGNTVYVWERSSSYTMPTQSNTTSSLIGNTIYSNTSTSGGNVLNYSCRTFFEVDEEGILVSWQFQGNDCR